MEKIIEKSYDAGQHLNIMIRKGIKYVGKSIYIIVGVPIMGLICFLYGLFTVKK